MTELLFYDDVNLRQCDCRVVDVGDDGIVLDRTVFYPVGGGQPGDSGVLRLQDGTEVPIETTRRRKEDGTVLHVPVMSGNASGLRQGDRVVASVDWQRRYAHMRVHTCLHLLSAVIRAGVTGGAIRDGSGRLDFDLPDAKLDRASVEADLNALIAEAHPVAPRWITSAELEAQPQLVKTMSVAPPGGVSCVRLLEIASVDLQACGGTHVSNTAEIGSVVVSKIESKGSHNRRVAVALAESPF
ncbi:MAG: alanyl-tRNA editing protein [Betaproteobacteria bacterium]|jgi:misacylated tRNA(Ala) deacylase|nr:MAG: alanyl-tRNA editing protein [Betaproteobacteria bacterium]